MSNTLREHLTRSGLALFALVATACASAPSARVEPLAARQVMKADTCPSVSHCTTPRNARRDVMTWREYYTTVMAEVSRRQAKVVWVNPPRAVRAEDRREMAAQAAAFHPEQGPLR